MWTSLIGRYLQFELMDLVSIVMDVKKRVAHELIHSPPLEQMESKILDENLASAQFSKLLERATVSEKSLLISEQADGSTVLDIQGGGDSLSRSNEDGPF